MRSVRPVHFPAVVRTVLVEIPRLHGRGPVRLAVVRFSVTVGVHRVCSKSAVLPRFCHLEDAVASERPRPSRAARAHTTRGGRRSRRRPRIPP